MEKIFAKPYLTSLTGHTDGISCMAKCPDNINKIISGGHDGQIHMWNIA